jgi:hypothetical protein
MRIARPLALALVTTALVTLQGVRFAAADTTVVVHGPGDLPSTGTPLGLFYTSCSSPGQGGTVDPGGIYIQPGPDPTPSGTRTWGFDLPGSASGFAIGPYGYTSSMANLATAQADFYADSGTATGIVFASIDEDPNTGTSWNGNAALSVTAGSWQTKSGIGLTYTWQELDGSFNPTGQTFSGTIAAMLAHIGTGDHDGLVGLGFGCNTPGLVHFDKGMFGATGAVTTYDFEGSTTRTTIKAVPSTITAGRTTALEGVMTDTHGGRFTSATLTLQKKPAGTSTWRKVGTAVETYDGTQHPAVIKQKPTTTTQYRYVFAGSSAGPGSTSKPVTVHVRTAVTAAPASKVVRKGGTITVNGRVSPKAPGHTVKLMRGSTQVGSATVRSTGAFALRTKARTTGRWTLHVTIGATRTDLAGSSRTFTVSVGSGRSSLPARATTALRSASPSPQQVAVAPVTSRFGPLTWRPAIVPAR